MAELEKSLTKEGPPQIDVGIVARVEGKRAVETVGQMRSLAGKTVEVELGGVKYTLYRPTAGKLDLIIEKISDVVVRALEAGKTVGELREAASQDTVILFRQLCKLGIDEAVDVIRIMLEPNTGKPIDPNNLSTPKDAIKWGADPDEWIAVMGEFYRMLNFEGLKKSFQQGAAGGQATPGQ